VELDGSAHEGETARERDRERDIALRKLGISVLHIRNELVIGTIQYVVGIIEEACLYL